MYYHIHNVNWGKKKQNKKPPTYSFLLLEGLVIKTCDKQFSDMSELN